MGCTTEPTPGHEYRCYVGAQAALGTTKYIEECTPIQFSTVDLGGEEVAERMNDGDRRGVRHVHTNTQITGRTPPTEWTLTQVLRPSGTAGTAPNADVLWEAAIGLGTNTPATSEVYTEVECHAPLGVSIFYGNARVMQAVTGAIVQRVSVDVPQDGMLMVTFSGTALKRGHFHQMDLTADPGLANEAGPSTAAVSRVYDSYGDAIFTVEADDEDLHISAFTHASGTATFVRAQNTTSAALHAQNTTITHLVPADSFAGAPILGYDCTWSLDGSATDLTFMGATWEFSNGIEFLPPEAGEDRSTAITRKDIETRGTVTFQGRDDDRLQLFGYANQHVEVDVDMDLGSTAGNMVKIDMPTCEVRPVSPAHPSDEAGIFEFTAEFVALPTSAGYDDVSVSFT